MWKYFLICVLTVPLAKAKVFDDPDQITAAIESGPVRYSIQPLEPFTPLEVPPLDVLMDLRNKADQYYKEIQQGNIIALEKGIDTPDGNMTEAFGPHLITHMESLNISQYCAKFMFIANGALKYAMLPKVTTSTTTPATSTTATPTSTTTTPPSTTTTPTSRTTTSTSKTKTDSPDQFDATTESSTATKSTSTFIPRERKKREAGVLLTDTEQAQIDQFLSALPSPSTLDVPCPFSSIIKCDTEAKYRTIDGSCNNLEHPYWGKSFTPFDRFLKPEYSTGADPNDDKAGFLPRAYGKLHHNLEEPREISNNVHTQSTAADLDPPLSYFTMQFGQFLDHDITKTALSKANIQGRYPPLNMDCCDIDRKKHPDCFPLKVKRDDPYHGEILNSDRVCINFVRSSTASELGCQFGYREQINELTHYIDGSGVYGSTAAELNSLKDPNNNGKMLVSESDRLPKDFSNAECQSGSGHLCFKAGDVRANVQPGLSSLHTIFVREHNRIAQYFIDHPECYDWDGETIFEEARRYVAAEIQHIAYNEFLPKLLNESIREQFGLIPLSAGYFTGYSPKVRPMIKNSFSTAAYRMGHSLLRDKFFFGSTSFDLHTQFNKPDLLYQTDGIEKCTGGLYENQAQEIDEKMTREVTWKLFETMLGNGGDLAAFNIQRGRDHGLPPYTKWLHWCTGTEVDPSNFIAGVKGGLLYHSAEAAGKLKSVYSFTCDIDLFPGAMSEDPLPGGRLGPTFTCILALQFKALKFGDRFFYEGNPALNPHPFTPEELDGFRPITMAKIICENTNIDRIPRDVFLEPNSQSNPYVNCSDLPDICFPKNGNWSEWKPSPCCNCCQIQEFRTCDNPAPNECGKPCEGYDFRSKNIGCNCNGCCGHC